MKITSRGYFMLVLKGLFGGSLKITSENKNYFWGKNSLKRFLGFQSLKIEILEFFWNLAAKVKQNAPKVRYGHFNSPNNGLFGHFNWLLGPNFRKGQNGIFRTLKCSFGVSGFRLSAGGPGDRKAWVPKDPAVLKTLRRCKTLWITTP